MIQSNLIRRIYPVDLRLPQDELPPMLEVAWPHLVLVYQILTRFLILTPKFPLHMTFAPLLLPIADSPDPSERAAIQSFYIHMIKALPSSRVPLIKAFCSYIKHHVHGTSDGPFAVSVVLAVFNHVLAEMSIFPEPVHVFVEVILPLFRHPLMEVFQGQLHGSVPFFFDINSGLAGVLARYLLARWPWTVASKQVFYIEYLFASLEKLNQKSIESLEPAMRRVLPALADTQSEKVGQALTGVWLRASGEKLNAAHGKILIPILAGTIASLSTNHWSPLVRQGARTALSVFQRRDPRAIQHALQSAVGEDPPPELAHWIGVISAAKKNDESIEAGHYFEKASAAYVPAPVDSTQVRLGHARCTSERGPVGRLGLGTEKRPGRFSPCSSAVSLG